MTSNTAFMLFLIFRVCTDSEDRKINVEVIQDEKGKRVRERERKDEKKKEPFENAERSNNASRHKQYVYPKEKLRLIKRDF